MKSAIIALLQNHKGKTAAITVAEISQRLGIQNPGLTCYSVRQVIKDIIKQNQVAIGSCNKGYYLIETEDERLQVIDNLTKRVNGIVNRIQALRGCPI